MPDDPPNTPLNAQIKEAVQTSTEYALGFAPLGVQTTDPSTRVSAGGAIAYDKAAQAAALAMQDAADYQRNVMSISAVVQGKAMAMILATEPPPEGAVVAYALALVSALAAPITAGVASASVSKSLRDFPKA